MSRPDYIFIVGLPRTGTTLVRNILNRSEEVGISKGESHFFDGRRLFLLLPRPGFRRKLMKLGDISTTPGAKKLANFLYNDCRNKFWISIPQNLDREDFIHQLLIADQWDHFLLKLGMDLGANGKPIRGEKTPAHIYSVPTLLKWFPNAKIIHMFRDPRAVYTSQKRKYEKTKEPLYSPVFRRSRLMFELYSSLNVSLAWLHAIRLHHKYQQTYPDSYYFLKYEDLVSNPGTSSRKLCDLLEIGFAETMLQQTVVNSSFVLPRDQKQGFDTDAINRWRKHLHPVTNYWFVLWCKKQLLELGYQP